MRSTINTKPASRLALALLAALLAGCSQTPAKLPFAALAPAAKAPGSGSAKTPGRSRPPPRRAEMAFAGGSLQLAAPQGYCFDQSSSRAEADGGFALIAHCSRVSGNGWFGARRAAVMTASIGPAVQGAAAPQARDIAAMFPAAKLLESRSGQLLPLVRLRGTRPAIAGASAEHWRGAFVLDRHLVALALYAPDGSPALGSQGAALLNELAHRSLEGSARLPDPGRAGRNPPRSTAAAAPALRPLPRPGPAAKAGKKRGLRQRIAGLFQ